MSKQIKTGKKHTKNTNKDVTGAFNSMHQEQEQINQLEEIYTRHAQDSEVSKLRLLCSSIQNLTYSHNLGIEFLTPTILAEISNFQTAHRNYFDSYEKLVVMIQALVLKKGEICSEYLVLIALSFINLISSHKYSFITDPNKLVIKKLHEIFSLKFHPMLGQNMIICDHDFLEMYEVRESLPKIIELFKIIFAGERPEIWSLVTNLIEIDETPTNQAPGPNRNNSTHSTYTGESYNQTFYNHHATYTNLPSNNSNNPESTNNMRRK